MLLAEICRLALSAPPAAVKLFANLHAIAFFARRACADGVQAVHGCFLNLPGLVAMGVSILTDLPLTVAGHGRDAFVDNRAVRSLARRANWVVLCHASAASELAERLDHTMRTKLVVLHHGLDPTEWGNPYGTRADEQSAEPLIFAAGRFVPKKGFDVLLRAIAILRTEGFHLRLVLAGDGPQADALRSVRDTLGLNDRVTCPGWLSEESLRRWLSRSTALVVPCVVDSDGDRDGIPNTVLEAWSLRIPVIASALPACARRSAIKSTACSCRREMIANWPRRSGECSATPIYARRLADGGWQRLRTDFNPEINSPRLANLFAAGRPEGA